MGMTIAEKILARASGLSWVEPGQLLTARLDVVMGHDVSLPMAAKEFARMGGRRVFDPERVILVNDHGCPPHSIKAAQACAEVRDFARKQGIRHFYDLGKNGISHVLLPELGLIKPGDLVIGGDSHTCTYGALGAFATGVGSTDLAAGLVTGECWFRVPESKKYVYYGRPGPWVTGKDYILYTIGSIGVDGALYAAMEFTGEAISALSMDGRFTMCNMAIEAGAKTGIVPPDEVTRAYMAERGKDYEPVASDPDSAYVSVWECDVSQLEPQVAIPHSPGNVRGVSAVAGVKVDQVIIGSCTNGRLEDLRLAAMVLKGRKVHPSVRAIVIPGSQRVLASCLSEGLLRIFLEAGVAISMPTCGPCYGGHTGLLAAGERTVSTTNRNFIGRMGHPESEIYLTNPAVAAASAVAGSIVHPREVMDK